MSGACDRCLRRGALIGFLSPQIAGVTGRPHRRTPSLLKLAEVDLIAAVGSSVREAAYRLLARFDADAERERLDARRTETICRHSPDYPTLLAELHDPPNPLYICGGVERLIAIASEPCVTVVGGRYPSDHARGVAQRMGRDLASAGVTVVSGLALGIDAESHRGALEGGGSPLAVVAGGPDVPYPARHRALHRRIVERGVVLSELPPGTSVRRWAFPARNRIMVGFAQAVVVVEAREASGSLITAEFAQEANRELAAVPGPVNARMAAGSNALLHQGAAFVRGAEDVLDLVFGVGQGPRPTVGEIAIEPQLREILDAIEVGDPVAPAAERVGVASGDVRAALGRLEALGLVRRDMFGGYERTGVRVRCT